jgi:hypothetical protein
MENTTHKAFLNVIPACRESFLKEGLRASRKDNNGFPFSIFHFPYRVTYCRKEERDGRE